MIYYVCPSDDRDCQHDWGTLRSHTLDTPNTTPEAVVLHRLLAEMRDAGVTDCVVEVSSHAMMEGRVEGIHFHAAAFTNLTHDHLDYHQSMKRMPKQKHGYFVKSN